MRPLHKAILGGAAAIAVVGVTGWAAAGINNTHVLDVRLPDGAAAPIRYVGETPPTVSFAAAPTAFSVFSPASDIFTPASPFAAMAQISAALDRQADAMLRDVDARAGLARGEPNLTQVDLGKLPAAAQGFSMVSTMSGSGVCTRIVQYRSIGDAKAPQVVARTSGDCAAGHNRVAPSATTGTAAATAQPRQARARPV